MAHAVAFYVDGGKGIGLGHAARGLGLAHAFKQRGFAPVFLIPADDILKAFLGGKPLRNACRSKHLGEHSRSPGKNGRWHIGCGLVQVKQPGIG